MFKLLLSLLVALAINSPGISERKQRGKLSSFDEFDFSVKDRVMQSLLNQMAGCVAFSFVYLGYRFITYGNGLTNGGGISVSTNVVEAY